MKYPALFFLGLLIITVSAGCGDDKRSDRERIRIATEKGLVPYRETAKILNLKGGVERSTLRIPDPLVRRRDLLKGR
jgi:hypothetical protein